MFFHHVISSFEYNGYNMVNAPQVMYSETSLIRSHMGLPKSDLNGEVTVLQGVKLHYRIQFGTEKG